MAVGPFITHPAGLSAQVRGDADYLAEPVAAVLVTNAHTPNSSTDVDYGDISGNECIDEDYAPVNLTTKTISVQSSVIRFSCAKITLTVSGSITGRYLYFVLGDAASLSSSDLILGRIDLTEGGSVSSTNTEFSFTPHTTGLFGINGSSESGSFGDAVSVTYDNSTSGLDADNVQEAIDVLSTKATTLGMRSLPLVGTFSDALGALTPTKEYVFGTGATASHANAVAITNLTELAEHWDPFQSFAGSTVINSELQDYVAFNSSNHSLVSDRLDLWGRLPGGSWSTQTYQVGVTPVPLNGTAIPIANVGLSNTTGLRVGQLVAVQFRGIYYINAIVTDTSISLTQLGGSSTASQTGNLIMFLPIDSAPLSSQHTGGTNTMVFSSVPAAVTDDGNTAIGYVTSSQPRNINSNYRVAGISGGTVTLDKNTNFGTLVAGTRIVFSPAITSGQIWSREMYDITNPQTFFALELDCHLYEGATIVDTLLMNNASTFNAMDSAVPMGAWPSWWVYGGDFYDDGGGQHTLNSSEIDFFENYYSTTIGPRGLVMNNANGGTTTLFSKNNAGWSLASGVYRKSTPITGARKFQFIFANGRTYRYVDDALIKMDRYDWVSQAPVQIGANLACGTISAGNGGSNLTIPRGPGSFTGMRFGLKNMKIWYGL